MSDKPSLLFISITYQLMLRGIIKPSKVAVHGEELGNQ